MLTHYKDITSKITTTEITRRNTPIWKIPQKLATTPSTQINANRIHEISGIKNLSTIDGIILIILLFAAFVLGFILRHLCQRQLKNKKKMDKLATSLLNSLKTYIIPITIFAITSLFFFVSDKILIPLSSLEMLSYTFFVFFLILAISKFLFSIKKDFPLEKTLTHRFIIAIGWGTIGYITYIIFRNQNISQPLLELVHTTFITVLSILIVIFCWTFTQTNFMKKNIAIRITSKLLLATLLLTILFTEWIGYHALAIYLISSIILTIILVGLTTILIWLISAISQAINNNQYKISYAIRRLLGIKPQKKIVELSLLKLIAYLIIISAFFLFFFWIWGFSANFIDRIMAGLIDGFPIGDLKVVPSRIIIAILLFVIIMLISRSIAAYIARQKRFSAEKEKQVTISTLITYIGFSIALLIALLASGVSFTGLAIIAGALSVGVGLGLQNIVNNFISGIILFLEKPIKPGDRVVIDDVEGFVKKIRIRSTQIVTLAKEDVIVPNADLISKKVTNYMFRDQYWRVVCKLGVAYGSPTELVKETLLEVASKHPDVVQEEPNKPAVLFKTFGESSLDFELWCIVMDVNKKYAIASELNFAIDQAFREKGITISFPQRDVHIRDHTEPDKTT